MSSVVHNGKLDSANQVKRLAVWFSLGVFLAFLIPLDFGVGYMRNRSDSAPPEVGESVAAGIRVYNPVFHHGFAPMRSEEQIWGQAVYTMHTNSLGFKDGGNFVVPLESDNYRILVMGDSFAEGIGVPHEETFAGILQDLLAGDGIEVLNASVASYSPKLMFLKLDYWLERGLRFDELAIFYDVSDASDELIYSSFRWDELNERGLAPERQRFEKGWTGPNRWYEYSLLYRTFQRLMFRSDPWKREVYINPETGESFSYYHERSEWVDGGAVYGRWGRMGLESGAFYVRRILELGERYDFSASVTIYPWPKEIMNDKGLSKNVEFWEEFAATEPVEVINLYPAFIDQPSPAEVISAYFIDRDVHWNSAGHQYVAAEWLKRRGPLR